MKIVVALGGNALLKRKQPLTQENQQINIKQAVKQIAQVVPNNTVIITHGNGPQIGLLAQQSLNENNEQAYPLDVLDSQTEGMIGYLIEQEMNNALGSSIDVVTVLTQVIVDINDTAFTHPTKPIGAVFNEQQAKLLADKYNWSIAPDGEYFRRVVPSPKPKSIVELNAIRLLVDKGMIVICAGGGGIPVHIDDNGKYRGVEAVIDKDYCSSLLADNIDADLLVIATDVDGIFLDWKTADQRQFFNVTPEELSQYTFPVGSMGPKVQAACEFVNNTGKRAVIGSLENIEAIVAGTAGTQITPTGDGATFHSN
jgi:carbamate kinase